MAVDRGPGEAPASRPGQYGPGRRGGRWSGRRPGSSPPLPAAQRAPLLQGGDLPLEQLVGHGDLAELGLEAEQLLVAPVSPALLHSRLRRDRGAVAPLAQAGGGDVELAG